MSTRKTRKIRKIKKIRKTKNYIPKRKTRKYKNLYRHKSKSKSKSKKGGTIPEYLYNWLDSDSPPPPTPMWSNVPPPPPSLHQQLQNAIWRQGQVIPAIEMGEMIREGKTFAEFLHKHNSGGGPAQGVDTLMSADGRISINPAGRMGFNSMYAKLWAAMHKSNNIEGRPFTPDELAIMKKIIYSKKGDVFLTDSELKQAYSGTLDQYSPTFVDGIKDAMNNYENANESQ